ncbi:DUF4175 family protein [Pacificimonas sp. WHA3]|uniref:DUF4175 family protein n=1 Tax=Pacificimonas pallii TaxID=2827236 RepID=A0ABS6SAV3_9SPHN|nr:DUF4175 family protein [Pacificimonas pallii]MBV7255539.1 DUF4175 family protein [Pacificimonas pallii]
MTAQPQHGGLTLAAINRLPLAGALIWLERGLAAELGWVLTAWTAFFAFSLMGMADILPGQIRLAIYACLIVGSIAALIRYTVRAPLPRRGQILARLETGGALPRGTISFTDSRPAALDGDVAEALWRRARADALAKKPRIGLPRLALPPALLIALISAAVLLFAGIAVAGRDAPERLAAGLSPYAVPAGDFTFQLEITPPDHAVIPPRAVTIAGDTRTAFDMLAGGRMDLVTAHDVSLVSPRGRRHGKSVRPARGGIWRIEAQGRALAEIDISLAADGIPEIRFEGSPVQTSTGALRLGYRLTDDHGASSLFLRVEGGGAPVRLVDLETLVPAGSGQLFADLTSDVRAGAEARLTLIARDGAGNEGRSRPLLVTLPLRAFTNDVAAQIIAIRKALLEGADRNGVVEDLAVIAASPDRFDDRFDTFAGLRAASWRLLRGREAQRRAEAARILWDTALDLEDGGASRAMDDLRAVLDRLMREAGSADDSSLAALMAQLESAMGDYIQRQIEAALANGELPSAEALRDMSGQMTGADMNMDVDMNFLGAMMADLKDRLAAGDTEGAMQALANVRSLMESLQFGPAAPDPEAQRRAEQARALANDMQALRDAQADLRDETLAEAVRQQLRGGDAPLDDLARGQDAIGGRLDELRAQLGDLGAAVPAELDETLDEARAAMRAAADALARGGNPIAAAQAQTLALEKLSQAGQQADAAAQAMAQAAAGGQMQPGGSGSGLDPLGRPGRGFGQGEVTLPDENELRRVQELRALIEERAADPARSAAERAYYLRLLKRF